MGQLPITTKCSPNVKVERACRAKLRSTSEHLVKSSLYFGTANTKRGIYVLAVTPVLRLLFMAPYNTNAKLHFSFCLLRKSVSKSPSKPNINVVPDTVLK